MRYNRMYGTLAAVAAALLAVGGCGKNESGPAKLDASGGGAAQTTAKGAPAKKSAQELQHPRVRIETSLGDIEVECDAKAAPQTVDNFLSYVDSGFYDQTVIHQVEKGRVVAGGTYDVKMAEKKTRTSIRNEAHNGLKNVRGTIAMGRAAKAVDSATSQFFFNLSDNSWLDHKERSLDGYGYCVFGRVTAGLEVLEKISAVPVQNRPPMEKAPAAPVIIKTMRELP